MNDDVIRCILEYTCHMQARRNVRPLEARHAIGEDETVSQIAEKVLEADGIVRSFETILLGPIRCNTSASSPAIRASQMVKTTSIVDGPNDLCIVDEVGDGNGMYDEARSVDGQNLGDVPMLFPCLAWGASKRVTYSICLNRATRVSVAFDVVVVPTSWWWWNYGHELEGMHWVIQIVDANQQIPEEVKLTYPACSGGSVVGWARRGGGES